MKPGPGSPSYIAPDDYQVLQLSTKPRSQPNLSRHAVTGPFCRALVQPTTAQKDPSFSDSSLHIIFRGQVPGLLGQKQPLGPDPLPCPFPSSLIQWVVLGQAWLIPITSRSR